MTRRSWWRGGLFGILLVGMLCASAQEAASPRPPDPPPIAITPQDGFNLEVVDQVTPHYVIVRLASPAHNWFAGTFTNLPTDTDTTIGLSMAGNDTKGNAADVKKWQGLIPVMTYADPTQYETYEWFTKDAQGRWVSGDPFKQGEAKFAGTGKVPVQVVMPPNVAEQFLSADGQYWSAWREVDKAEAVLGINVFRITQRFAHPTATVAMRVPYTYTYLQAFLAKLQAAQLPGVTVDEIGKTPEGRKLQCLRIEAAATTRKPEDHQTVLVLAREHATEHTSSWALHGMLAHVFAPTQSRLHESTTWLFIPIQDPDGSAESVFDRVTDHFLSPDDPVTPPEVYAYARYITNYIYNGRTIDVTISLHNVEANEAPNLLCPFIDARFEKSVINFNSRLFIDVSDNGYATADPSQSWGTGLMGNRLYGWIAMHFGSFDLCYEINDRFPRHRLSLAQTCGIGTIVSTKIGQWVTGRDGQYRHKIIIDKLDKRRDARVQYYKLKNRTPISRNYYDLLCQGF